MNEGTNNLRKELGIDDWLKLVEEDKNLNGAYISFAQYIYLLEKENQELKKQLSNYKNRYTNYLNCQLSEDIEPDPEDFYLAEIEGKANDYDYLKTKYNNLLKENFKLKHHPQNNWNKLKKWMEECLKEQTKNRLYDNNSYQAGIIDAYENVIDKMQKLEVMLSE